MKNVIKLEDDKHPAGNSNSVEVFIDFYVKLNST